MPDPKSQPMPIRPLARKIKVKPYRFVKPAFKTVEIEGTERVVPSVSYLRINRLLAPPGKEIISPLIIKGERVFEPSEEIRKRLRTITEEIPEVPPVAVEELPPEERERRIEESMRFYTQQVESLSERSKKLGGEIGKAEEEVERLTGVKPKKGEEKELAAQVEKLEAPLELLKQEHQGVLAQLAKVRKKWKERTLELQELKAKEKYPPEERERLGAEIARQQEVISGLSAKRLKLEKGIREKGEELERLRSALEVLASQNKEKERLVEEQKKRLEQLEKDKEKISRFANELVKKLAQVEELQRREKEIRVVREVRPAPKVEKPEIRVVPPLAPEEEVPQLTQEPNAINGVIKDGQGRLVQNALIIIKSKEGQAQRALRTNELGQFVISTPLPNGVYRIEVEKAGLKFDIIEIKLDGSILAPIEIRAHE